MATWLPHLRLSFGGTLGQPGAEQWANTVRFKIGEQLDPSTPSAEVAPEDLDEALGLLNAPLQAWFHDPASQISAYCQLEWAKLNFIKADGMQRDSQTHRIDTGLVAGGNTDSAPHWFTTAALTMRTDLARGRGHAGRIFPPMIAAKPEGGKPYLVESVANNMASKWAAALNGISAAIKEGVTSESAGALIFPVIASPATSLGGVVGNAILQRVVGVVVDRVADVQHRRTRQVPRLESSRVAVTGA